MSSRVIEMFREAKETEHTWVNEPMEEASTVIVSKVRESSGGAFLKARKGQGCLSTISVDFVGNNYESTTEFYVGKKDTPGENFFKCHINGQQYYLCTENNQVFLTRCADSDPSDRRFLFKVLKASNNYCNITSVQTGKFLISDESGNASMKEIKETSDGHTDDRQAWFQFIGVDMVTEKSIHKIREDTIFAARTFEIQAAVTCTLTKV